MLFLKLQAVMTGPLLYLTMRIVIFTPSVNSSFVFTDAFAATFENVGWLNYGKIRASWAEGSVDDAPYQINPTYKIGSWRDLIVC